MSCRVDRAGDLLSRPPTGRVRQEVDAAGFALVRGACAAPLLADIGGAVSVGGGGSRTRRRDGAAYAIRNLLWERPGLAALLRAAGLDSLAAEALGRHSFPISATLFAKPSGANWAVPPHQDLMVPVDSEAAAPGFERWVRKLGVAYVEPPVEVLERLVALRLHLDDCGDADGPLAVVPRSHHHGKLRAAAIGALDRASFVSCEAMAGDVLLMKPLLVHRSSSSRRAAGRRVLHVVYATEQPGGGVRWCAPC